MATYVTLYRYTDEGIKKIKDAVKIARASTGPVAMDRRAKAGGIVATVRARSGLASTGRAAMARGATGMPIAPHASTSPARRPTRPSPCSPS